MIFIDMKNETHQIRWHSYPYRSLWQHPLWAEFQESVGRKTFFVRAKGADALLIRHALPLGLCWLEVPRGPLFESEDDLPELMEKIKALARKEKAIFVRMSPYEELRVNNYELRVADKDHQPETSLVIDLTVPEEEILKQMKPKGRYNIRVAQKNGVEVRPTDEVEAFHGILVQTGGRDGFGIHPQRYYHAMLESLGDHAQLLMAYHQGKAIAGGLFVYLGDCAIYYYGASDHAHRPLMAPYLIQWEAMREAKKRGCRFYDFLGIAPEDAENHPWAGVTDFKKKFGGRVVNYPKAVELTIRPFWHFLYRLRQYLK